MDILSTPLEKIIDALELDQLPEQEQEEIMSDVGSIIFQSYMIKLMQLMDPKTKEEFGALIDGDASEEEVAAFVEANVPDSNKIIKATIDEMVDDILAVTGSVAA
ncbi:hypothetical protein KJ848_00750 [Patescibacteria group bacterium]|nr:hypothetical protein [Patescibacteria group bacterium]